MADSVKSNSTVKQIMATPVSAENLRKLSGQLYKLRQRMLEKEAKFQHILNDLHPNYTASGRNLIHYLTLRSFSLRRLQDQLSNIGLSTMSTSESYSLSNLEYIISFLDSYHSPQAEQGIFSKKNQLDYLSSIKLLKKNTIRLFGKAEKKRPVHVMVTLPTEAASDEALILNLIQNGMNVARINCSHDDETIWEQMIQGIKKAEKETGKSCKISMDLGGPKLRTGPVEKTVKKKKKKKKEKVVDYLSLQKGDLLELHKKIITGKNAREKKGKMIPAKISLTLPSVFKDVKAGDRIMFDDGKIKGKITAVRKDKMIVQIKNVGSKKGRLRAGKGINLPDSQLQLPALTAQDLAQLPFITKHADIVGFSFVNQPEDIAQLQQALKELKRENIGIVLKIETTNAFNNLPALLLQAMKSPNVGVMTARGDLAIEIGWERLAEVQQQIISICEAAHVPQIWATQVLENLAKRGLATRAEITDASMSIQSECVMLNKGPYILDALKSLIDILQRMQAHQRKRKRTSRKLEVAKRFFKSPRLS